MVFFNIITSHGEKLNIDIDVSLSIDNICKKIYSMIENTEYIELFDLTLRYENTILMLDRTLESYRIPENSKLSFILRRRSIDFNSPTIYDSPVSIKQVKNKPSKTDSTYAMLERINNNLLNLSDEIHTIKEEIKYIKNDMNDIHFHIDQIKKDIDNENTGNDIFPMLA